MTALRVLRQQDWVAEMSRGSGFHVVLFLKEEPFSRADLSLGGGGVENVRSSHDFRYYLMGRGSLGMGGMGWDDVVVVVVVMVAAKLEGEIASEMRMYLKRFD
jgi:hypothetical protein